MRGRKFDGEMGRNSGLQIVLGPMDCLVASGTRRRKSEALAKISEGLVMVLCMCIGT